MSTKTASCEDIAFLTLVDLLNEFTKLRMLGWVKTPGSHGYGFTYLLPAVPRFECRFTREIKDPHEDPEWTFSLESSSGKWVVGVSQSFTVGKLFREVKRLHGQF
jgi:hypothetical protein